jgi:hypothetical protein
MQLLGEESTETAGFSLTISERDSIMLGQVIETHEQLNLAGEEFDLGQNKKRISMSINIPQKVRSAN